MPPSIGSAPQREPNVRLQVGGALLTGWAADGFDGVVDVFRDNFVQRGELGAALCIRQGGETVVDLWGGFADPERQTPWRPDTLAVVFSCTKAASAMCIHHLAAQGQLSLDARVTDYWPGYGVRGKQDTTVRMVLEHMAGVPVLAAPLKPGALEDFDYMVDLLEGAEPLWRPGSTRAYHPITQGYLLGELVRRITGMSLGAYLRKALTAEAGIDFWIGLPEAQESRAAVMHPFKGAGTSPEFQKRVAQPGTVQNLFVFNSSDWSYRGLNTRACHAAEIPAANGMASGRGLAGLYDLCVGASHPHARGLRDALDALARDMSSVAARDDETLLIPTRFLAGFMLSMDNPEGVDSMRLSDTAFGHCGMGGSVGFADPACDLSFGYVMNALGPGVLLNPRGQSLVDACYAALAAR